MEQRRMSKKDGKKYQILNKEIKKKCNEAKEKIHDKIKEISGKRNSTQSSCIKSKEGNILLDKEDILCRWAEYIEELFDDDRGGKPNITKKI